MRRTCHSKTDWVDIKFRGATLQHPVQKDGDSCGVIVIKMAEAFLEAFPSMPTLDFLTTKKEMAKARQRAELVLEASVFDTEEYCALCAATKPPSPGPPITDWLQCDGCYRWYHCNCLQMDKEQFQEAEKTTWKCILC
ncbi:unnamed protein product [Gadus morhua 'NCC']